MITPPDCQFLIAAFTCIKFMLGIQDPSMQDPDLQAYQNIMIGEVDELKVVIKDEMACFFSRSQWRSKTKTPAHQELDSCMRENNIFAVMISPEGLWYFLNEEERSGECMPGDAEPISYPAPTQETALQIPEEFHRVSSQKGVLYITKQGMNCIAKSIRTSELISVQSPELLNVNNQSRMFSAGHVTMMYTQILEYPDQRLTITTGSHLHKDYGGQVTGLFLWQPVPEAPAARPKEKDSASTLLSSLSTFLFPSKRPKNQRQVFDAAFVLTCIECSEDMTEGDIELSQKLGCRQHLCCKSCLSAYLDRRIRLFPNHLPACIHFGCPAHYTWKDIEEVIGKVPVNDDLTRSIAGMDINGEPLNSPTCPKCNKPINPDELDRYSVLDDVLLCPSCEQYIFVEEHHQGASWLSISNTNAKRLHQKGICYKDTQGQTYSELSEVAENHLTTDQICDICANWLTHYDINLKRRLTCGENHSVCARCYRNHCALKIKENQAPQCPASGCNETLNEDDLEIISRDTILSSRYATRTAGLLAIVKNDEYFICPRPDCGYVGLKPEARSDTLIIPCPKCNYQHTFIKVEQKPFMQLLQQQDNSTKTSHFIKGQIATNKIKPCPSCNTLLEHNQGCAHMVCKLCKHSFCWVCLNDWDKRLAVDDNHSSCNVRRGTTRRRIKQIALPDELQSRMAVKRNNATAGACK